MAFKRVFLLAFGMAMVSAPSTAFADQVYTFIVKKQEEKAQTRRGWNLADWIVQRDRMRTQDLWLAMHTPTPYEFFFGGDYRILSNPKDERDHRLMVGAFAKIFGLTFEKESRDRRFNMLLNFRVFGLYQQATNLTLYGGMRTQSGTQSLRSGIVGASATIYLSQFFGVEGSLRKIYEATGDREGAGKGGVQHEENLFIDFRFLRIYGGWIETRIDSAPMKGYQIGTRIFF